MSFFIANENVGVRTYRGAFAAKLLLLLFKMKKSAAESRRWLVEPYGDDILSEQACREWFRRFRSGELDFEDKQRAGPSKKFEDAELQALLDQDDAQTEEQISVALNVDQSTISRRLHELGKIQKATRWAPRELNDRQKEKRKTTCEILLQRQSHSNFLHHRKKTTKKRLC